MSEDRSGEDKAQDTPRASYQRNKSVYPLPDVNHSFDFQMKMLGACVVTSDYGKRESNIDQVQNSLGNRSEAIGTGISFLASLGLLIGDRNSFKPTEKAIDLFYARKQGEESEARKILASVIDMAWFTKSARQVIEVRGPVTETDLIAKLARECLVDSDKRERSFKSLIEYLKYSNIIIEQEDQRLIIAQNAAQAPSGGETGSLKGAPATDQKSDPLQADMSVEPRLIRHESAGSQFVINLNFEISPTTDVDVIRKLVRAIKEELAVNDDST